MKELRLVSKSHTAAKTHRQIIQLLTIIMKMLITTFSQQMQSSITTTIKSRRSRLRRQNRLQCALAIPASRKSLLRKRARLQERRRLYSVMRMVNSLLAVKVMKMKNRMISSFSASKCTLIKLASRNLQLHRSRRRRAAIKERMMQNLNSCFDHGHSSNPTLISRARLVSLL